MKLSGDVTRERIRNKGKLKPLQSIYCTSDSNQTSKLNKYM